MAIRRIFMLVLVVAMFGANAIVQAAAESGGASRFIRDLGDQAIQVLQTPGLTWNSGKAVFVTSCVRPSISSAVRPATKRAGLTQLFGEYILQTYASRFGGYAGERLAIAEPAGKTDVVVRTRIDRPRRVAHQCRLAHRWALRHHRRDGAGRQHGLDPPQFSGLLRSG